MGDIVRFGEPFALAYSCHVFSQRRTIHCLGSIAVDRGLLFAGSIVCGDEVVAISSCLGAGCTQHGEGRVEIE